MLIRPCLRVSAQLAKLSHWYPPCFHVTKLLYHHWCSSAYKSYLKSCKATHLMADVEVILAPLRADVQAQVSNNFFTFLFK